MAQEPIISFSNVSFTYQGQTTPVLRHVSFSVAPGTVTLLCGPTGSGKTTLIRLFNGLIPHFHEGVLEGEVIVGGRDVRETSTAGMAQVVGMVFQNPDNQLVASSCEREITFGPENLGLPREEISARLEEAITLLDLEALRDSSPNALSGGQKQKVAIAAALALRPAILVFDEPSSNLDPCATLQLFDTIAMVNRSSGTTIIIVEHKLELFLELATHVLCLNQGEIILDGPVPQVVGCDDLFSSGVQVPVLLKLFYHMKRAGLYQGDMPMSTRDALARIEGMIHGRVRQV